MKRGVVWAGVGLVAASLGLAVYYSDSIAFQAAKLLCKQSPSSVCLSKIAAQSLENDAPMANVQAVGAVYASGQPEIAREMALSIDETFRLNNIGQMPRHPYASVTFNNSWATDQLRRGISAEQLIAMDPPLPVDVSLYTAVLDVLNLPEHFYSGSEPVAPITEARLIEILRVIALEKLNNALEDENPVSRNYGVSAAAELFALSGDPRSARSAFAAWVPDTKHRINFTSFLVQSIGADFAYDLYRRQNQPYGPSLVRIAKFAETPSKQASYLAVAFDTIMRANDYSQMASMGKVVKASAALGLDDLAASQTNMMKSIQISDDDRFRIFKSLDVMEAMIITNAPRSEIRAALQALGRTMIDENTGEPVTHYVGAVNLLTDDARIKLAILYTKIDDIEAASRVVAKLPKTVLGSYQIMYELPYQQAVTLLKSYLGPEDGMLKRKALIYAAARKAESRHVDADARQWMQEIFNAEVANPQTSPGITYTGGLLALATALQADDTYAELADRYAREALASGYSTYIAEAARYHYQLIEKGAPQ